MSREELKNCIDLIPENDVEEVYKFVIKFIPEDDPTEEEIRAFKESDADTSPTISHEDINWD